MAETGSRAPGSATSPSPNGRERRYALHRLLMVALDPVHVGAGGMQLGRVDLSIVRETGTRLPKIPGTTLSGIARTYAAYQFKTPRCAGQGTGGAPDAPDLAGGDGAKADNAGNGRTPARSHCGKPTCPICYAFGSLGTLVDGTQRAMAGTVGLADAHVLFFPVASTQGPIWISTADRLTEAGFGGQEEPRGHGEARVSLAVKAGKSVNLGWLLLTATPGLHLTPPARLDTSANGWTAPWEAIVGRIALVTERIFSQVVNANLEVRTSVSIDPFTGAAKTGALFSYEAIPRATWLLSDVIEDDYRGGFPTDVTIEGRGTPVDTPYDVARAGLELAEWLGVGGMGTRGFGRLRIIAGWNVPYAEMA